MKKLIDPGKAAITEYYCDGCHSLVLIEGLPEDEVPETHKEFSVALDFNFGYNTKYNGLFGDLHFCNECGIKLIKVTETLFSIKIESPIFSEGE
jgi:hypothetical protein